MSNLAHGKSLSLTSTHRAGKVTARYYDLGGHGRTSVDSAG